MTRTGSQVASTGHSLCATASHHGMRVASAKATRPRSMMAASSTSTTASAVRLGTIAHEQERLGGGPRRACTTKATPNASNRSIARGEEAHMEDDIQAMMAETQDLLSHVNRFLDDHCEDLTDRGRSVHRRRSHPPQLKPSPVHAHRRYRVRRKRGDRSPASSVELGEVHPNQQDEHMRNDRRRDMYSSTEEVQDDEEEDAEQATGNERSDGDDDDEREEKAEVSSRTFQSTETARSPYEQLTTRQINMSKVGALKIAILDGLLRLGFQEPICLDALDTSAQEIDQFEADCELAYVDIFMHMIKTVTEAHAGHEHAMDDFHTHALLHQELRQLHEAGGQREWNRQNADERVDSLRNHHSRQTSEFEWPVFDMAQFEFGNARPDTRFEAVCVITNLPKLALDRTDELMEILSCHLFCMLGDPVQVVIPSVGATGRTKGTAFVEFDDPELAQLCALAVDGLAWGRGTSGRVQARLFREYHAHTPEMNQEMSSADHSVSGLDHESEREAERHDEGTEDEGHESDPFYTTRGLSSSRSRAFEGSARQANAWHDDDNSGNLASPFLRSQEVRSPSRGGNVSQGNNGIMRLEELSLDGADEPRNDFNTPRHYFLRPSGTSNQSSYAGSYSSHSSLSCDSTSPIPNGNWQTSSSMRSVRSASHVSNLPHVACERAPSTAPMWMPSTDSVTEIASALPPFPVEPSAETEDYRHVASCSSDAKSKPWRTYCEELIARNHHLQQQLAFLRRRVVQLGHHNQKLHLLVDRMERDRDGLLFENDLLQAQMSGYEENERRQEMILNDMMALRKELEKKERKCLSQRRLLEQLTSRSGCNFARSMTSPTSNSTDALSHTAPPIDLVHYAIQRQLSPTSLSKHSFEELKEWEQALEASLAHVRTVKEEKALSMQKQLDRRVEEQMETKLCVICLSKDKSILCLPCRHLCLCSDCSQREEVDKCPICRVEIEEMLLVYA